ncbi:hypothetical protein JYU34_015941 [Plutella xylostella]|uniref:Uncharacterized protein n=1 Tax=Plutella xylostella TaxID=51655 RepID=A0ABQ7Q588_PLUXY|nr:hypothetical protein JYU34_015941 [Plutella xylostella]
MLNMDNITLRKNRNKSSSNPDITNSSTMLDETVWNSTILDSTTQSLPPTILDTSQVSELLEEIKLIKINLESANTEIEKLITENYDLKSKLEEKGKEIELIRKISLASPCIRTPIKHTPTKKTRKIGSHQKSLLERHLTYVSESSNSVQGNNEPDMTNTHIQATSPTTEGTTDLNKSMMKRQLQQKPTAKPLNKCMDSKKPNIYIIGDENLRGLASTMHDCRKNTWNDIYKISSTIKPHANSSQILHSVYNNLSGLTNDDIFVLSAGNHDSCNEMFLCELGKTLKSLANNHVFILSVTDSENETTFNKILLKLERQYPNCKIINTKNMQGDQGRNCIIDQICFKLNVEIDFLKYRNDYIINWKKIVRNGKKNEKLFVKGTIPYFFNKQSMKNMAKIDCKSEPELVKGTIPYFFNKQKIKNMSAVQSQKNVDPRVHSMVETRAIVETSSNVETSVNVESRVNVEPRMNKTEFFRSY